MSCAPDKLYDWLLARAAGSAVIERLVLGINWTCAQLREQGGTESYSGLCFSPVDATRTMSWPGTVAGSAVADITPWLVSWDPCQAAVGAAVVNAAINSHSPLLAQTREMVNDQPPHLRVFGHFLPQLTDQKVTVIGHYPGMESLVAQCQLTCLERRPQPGDLSDTAAEFVLPQSDWVFISASSIANKTLPRLLQLSRHAQVVLMGPSLPWLAEWSDFGVNYLAGVVVHRHELLFQVCAEGGGTRIFDEALSYRLLALG